MNVDYVLMILTVGVDWKIADPSVLNLSDKDRNAPLLRDAEIN